MVNSSLHVGEQHFKDQLAQQQQEVRNSVINKKNANIKEAASGFSPQSSVARESPISVLLSQEGGKSSATSSPTQSRPSARASVSPAVSSKSSRPPTADTTLSRPGTAESKTSSPVRPALLTQISAFSNASSTYSPVSTTMDIPHPIVVGREERPSVDMSTLRNKWEQQGGATSANQAAPPKRQSEIVGSEGGSQRKAPDAPRKQSEVSSSTTNPSYQRKQSEFNSTGPLRKDPEPPSSSTLLRKPSEAVVGSSTTPHPPTTNRSDSMNSFNTDRGRSASRGKKNVLNGVESTGMNGSADSIDNAQKTDQKAIIPQDGHDVHSSGSGDASAFFSNPVLPKIEAADSAHNRPSLLAQSTINSIVSQSSVKENSAAPTAAVSVVVEALPAATSEDALQPIDEIQPEVGHFHVRTKSGNSITNNINPNSDAMQPFGQRRKSFENGRLSIDIGQHRKSNSSLSRGKSSGNLSRKSSENIGAKSMEKVVEKPASALASVLPADIVPAAILPPPTENTSNNRKSLEPVTNRTSMEPSRRNGDQANRKSLEPNRKALDMNIRDNSNSSPRNSRRPPSILSPSIPIDFVQSGSLSQEMLAAHKRIASSEQMTDPELKRSEPSLLHQRMRSATGDESGPIIRKKSDPLLLNNANNHHGRKRSNTDEIMTKISNFEKNIIKSQNSGTAFSQINKKNSIPGLLNQIALGGQENGQEKKSPSREALASSTSTSDQAKGLEEERSTKFTYDYMIACI